jgi:hypothetical protein
MCTLTSSTFGVFATESRPRLEQRRSEATFDEAARGGGDPAGVAIDFGDVGCRPAIGAILLRAALEAVARRLQAVDRSRSAPTVGCSLHSGSVLDTRGQLQPLVLAALVHRHGRCWEIRVREGTDRYRDQSVAAVRRVVDRGSTRGAEAKPESGALIPDSKVLDALAADLESGRGEPSLCTEDASRSPLTRKAVAHRHPDGLTLHFDLKLAAGA